MAKPTTRQEFADFCLRRLGGGAVKINVTDDQVDDRIDEAVNYWQQYHHSGTTKVYYAHQIDDTDRANKYITVPESIIGVVRLFPVTGFLSSGSLFGMSFELAMSDILLSTLDEGLVPYWLTMTHVELIQQVLVGNQPIRYNQHQDHVYLDLDWNTKLTTGRWVVLEAYEALDPEDWPDAWNDIWLQRYAIALIKRQWGENTKKWGNIPGPGGVTINGQLIYDEAEADIAKLEREMLTSFSLPSGDFIG
jgi:hypothetical protein